MKLSNKNILKALFERSVFYTAEVCEAGTHSSSVSSYLKTNRKQLTGCGIYGSVETNPEEFFSFLGSSSNKRTSYQENNQED